MSGYYFVEAPNSGVMCPCGKMACQTMNECGTGKVRGYFCSTACGLYADRLGFPATFPPHVTALGALFDMPAEAAPGHGD